MTVSGSERARGRVGAGASHVSPKPRNSQPAVTVHHAQLEDDVVHFPWPQWRHRRNPIDGGKMHGRDGILAHSYMLGLNGQSNGCVSFNDYAAFLDALLRGDVDRLVVVEHLTDAPPH
jgi:hypothetical protein